MRPRSGNFARVSLRRCFLLTHLTHNRWKVERGKWKVESGTCPFVLCPSSFVPCPLSFVLCPSSFVLCPLSFVPCPSSFVLCILMFALMCTKVNCLVLESDIKKTRYGDPCLKNRVMAIFPFCRDKACLVRYGQTFGNQQFRCFRTTHALSLH